MKSGKGQWKYKLQDWISLNLHVSHVPNEFLYEFSNNKIRLVYIDLEKEFWKFLHFNSMLLAWTHPKKTAFRNIKSITNQNTSQQFSPLFHSHFVLRAYGLQKQFRMTMTKNMHDLRPWPKWRFSNIILTIFAFLCEHFFHCQHWNSS